MSRPCLSGTSPGSRREGHRHPRRHVHLLHNGQAPFWTACLGISRQGKICMVWLDGVFFQIANGDMSKWLGNSTAGLLNQLFGDHSFPSFVKMLTMKNRQVSLTRALENWVLWIGVWTRVNLRNGSFNIFNGYQWFSLVCMLVWIFSMVYNNA